MNRYTPEELALLTEEERAMEVDAQRSRGAPTPPPPSTQSLSNPGTSGERRERSSSSSSTSHSTDEFSLPRAYFNVRAARAATMTVQSLGNSAVCTVSSVGTFIVQNDSRALKANHRHCYGKKANFFVVLQLRKISMQHL
jgi:hypothetical protein